MIYSFYTDGACSGNPGAGGYGVAVVHKDEVVAKYFGSQKETTNNRMEMLAVVYALKIAARIKGSGETPTVVEINSDSAYVVNANNDRWMEKWLTNNWTTVAGKDVVNKDLWLEMWNAKEVLREKGIPVVFRKVKGHSGDKLNDLADKLAKHGATAAKLGNIVRLERQVDY